VPAYWLTRTELERQAWRNVQNAQQATLSLLQAEQARLASLTTLFSERPTLHRLIRDQAAAELARYLAAFQAQSQLDLLLFCPTAGQTFAGQPDAADCPLDQRDGIVIWADKPWLLSSQSIADDAENLRLGTAVAGITLDDRFWQQMAANTGAEQSLLAANGSHLVSSIRGATQAEPVPPAAPGSDGERRQIQLAGRQFYAYVTSLAADAGLWLEVALPIDDLLAAEQRAFLIFALSTGLIALVGVLLAIGFVRRLTHPLLQLTQAAERISQGNFVTAIPAFATPLEVATLSTALIKSQATMVRALEERSDFLAGMSHEFQTPLSTLRAALELVIDNQEALSAEEMREVLKPAHMSLVGLKNLIDNLLQSSSIEAGQFALRRESIDLVTLIEAARRLVQPLLDRRRQLLHLPASGQWPTLQADSARLTQVLVNLLVNASKYSPVGSQIDLLIEMQENALRVSVADRGVGIPAGAEPRLFQRFVRVGPQAREQAGVGLGLYVVKTTVEAHGGVVGVERRSGGGSIFWFTLPYE
jgi:signal transduction histidine kinase